MERNFSSSVLKIEIARWKLSSSLNFYLKYIWCSLFLICSWYCQSCFTSWLYEHLRLFPSAYTEALPLYNPSSCFNFLPWLPLWSNNNDINTQITHENMKGKMIPLFFPLYFLCFVWFLTLWSHSEFTVTKLHLPKTDTEFESSKLGHGFTNSHISFHKNTTAKHDDFPPCESPWLFKKIFFHCIIDIQKMIPLSILFKVWSLHSNILKSGV